MAEKTIVEKAAEIVGYGIAMAEDVAGSVKTAVGTAVTTITEVLTKSPSKKSTIKKTAQRAPGGERKLQLRRQSRARLLKRSPRKY